MRSSKFLLRISIPFVWKSDDNVYLCIGSQGFDNLIIKNQYISSLVGEFLDWLSWAKQFIQPDFISAYYQIKICEEDKWKTVFYIRYCHFEYQMMLFILLYGSISFHKYIHNILAQKLNVFVIVHLDNIRIYTNKAAHFDAI